MLENVNVSASIVTYNCKQKALAAVKSLTEHTKKYPFSLYVFDNGSTDNIVEELSTLEGVSAQNTGANLGFGKAHNKALSKDLGKYHAVINPDITVDYDVIASLVDVLEANEDIVMITPKILNADGSIQHLPKRAPTFKYLFLGRLAFLKGPFLKARREYTLADENLTGLTDISFCTGCFFIMRSEVFKKLGGFDEDFFMYMEDADLTLRAKKYGRVVYDAENYVTHLWERESAKSLKYLIIHFKSCLKFFKKRREKKSQ